MKKLKLTENQLLNYQKDGSFKNYLAFYETYQKLGISYSTYVDYDSGGITFSLNVLTPKGSCSGLILLMATRLHYSLITDCKSKSGIKRTFMKHSGVLKGYSSDELTAIMTALPTLM